MNDDFLKTIWINRLPSYLQPHLVGQTGVSLDQQASMADIIVNISNNKNRNNRNFTKFKFKLS